MGNSFYITRSKREKLQKDIDKYNRKISKMIKSGIDKSAIPNKLNYVDVIMGMNNRRDFELTNLLIKPVLKKGSDKVMKSERGGQLTKAKFDQYKVKLKEKNKHIQEKINEYKEKGTIGGRKMTDKEFQHMQDDINSSKIRMQKFNFKNKSKEDLRWFEKTLKNYNKDHHYNDEVYKKNYLKSMEQVLTPELYNKLVEFMKNIAASDVVRQYYIDTSLQIQFNYTYLDEEENELDQFYETTIRNWKKSLNIKEE